MKKLKIPQPKYDFYDSSLIKNTLDRLQKSKIKRDHGITLYGIYKKIRAMPIHAGLGDFIILSICVDWLRKVKPPTKTEIRRCMMYFEPSLNKGERMQLVKTFF